MPGCKLPNEDHQAFHEAMAESQKAKKNDNLTVFSARQLVSDPSDDFIDDDPTAAPDAPAVDPILNVYDRLLNLRIFDGSFPCSLFKARKIKTIHW